MTTEDLETLAAHLVAARERRAPLELEKFPELPEDAAYEVQRHVVRMLCADGMNRIAGFKISMTSPEMQALAGASEPAYGTFTSDMVLSGGVRLSLGGCLEPLLEVELQVIADDDLPNGASRDDIIAACSVAPGIELPDSRFARWFGNASVSRIVSDNAVAGHVVVGDATPLRAVGDVASIGAALYRDGERIASGDASAVLGDPLVAVEWLTRRLAGEGRALTCGMVVSSGTLTTPIRLEPGDYTAAYDRLGNVDLSVVP
jgi:2-keto-4-pentenoate hydratase